MILSLLVVALVTTQAYLLGVAWFGAFAFDPIVVVAAVCALALTPGRMLLAAVLLGWGRALVLLEPAGGQILCAYCAMSIIAGLRSQVLLLGGTGLLVACVVGAGCWSLCARVLAWATDQPVTGGRELLLGAVCSVFAAGLLRRIGTGAGATV